MSDPTPTSAFFDGRAPDGGKAVQSAFAWLLTSLVTAVAIFAVTLLVWAQNERAAGRMIILAQKADGYLPMLASQVATTHGRANGH